MCGDSAIQAYTATLNIGSGITWTGSIYTNSLGLGDLAQPLEVVPGTVQVLIDGVDRTALLAITLGPPLEIDFAGMSA